MLWEIPISKVDHLSGLTGKHFCFLPKSEISPLEPGRFPLFPYMYGKKQANSQWFICPLISEPTLGPHLLFPANQSPAVGFQTD